jgi:nicotinamide riboside transporter PnuC
MKHLDIVAGIFELIGLYFVGHKNPICFIFFIIGSLLWVYVGISKKIYGLLLICVPAILLNINNVTMWLDK